LPDYVKLELCTPLSYLEPIYEDWTPGDIRVFNVDNSKLCGLGFEFQTDFDEGLQETLQWYHHKFCIGKDR